MHDAFFQLNRHRSELNLWIEINLFLYKSVQIFACRCKVPECDVGENDREIAYDQPWLSSAIPYSNHKFDQCFRYAPKNFSTHQNGICSTEMFDNATKIPCTEFIYASDEINIQTEVFD